MFKLGKLMSLLKVTIVVFAVVFFGNPIEQAKGQSVTFRCGGDACGEIKLSNDQQTCMQVTNLSDRYIRITMYSNYGGSGIRIAPGSTKTVDHSMSACITLNGYQGIEANYESSGRRRRR
jgi:hypothetical protein